MAKDAAESGACVRVVGASCLSVLLQLVCVAVLFVGSFFSVAYALEVVEVGGISTIPPGIKYAPRVP